MRFSKEKPEEIVSILGEGLEMTGEVSFTQGLRVDGILKGKIRSESLLVVGPKGKIEAEARIRRILINGEYRGTIHASDRVEVHREGRVYGELFTPCLIIEAGAFFEGKCNMSDRRPARREGESASGQAGQKPQDPAAQKNPGGDKKPFV
ncbi:MAG: polymer-forming cytoskeletal protein [Acidobacteria bacterium]|nr:polymer-forming cytoskeletal protein [Acidobacteriota bacterium]